MKLTICHRALLLVHDLFHRNRIKAAPGNIVNIAFAERLRMKKVDILIRGSGNSLSIGSGTMVARCKIRIDGSNQSVRIGSNCLYHAGKIYLRYNKDQHITIGDDTTIEDAYLLTDENASISIGRDCMFSKFVHLRAGDGHSVLSQDTGKRINRSRDIKLGNHVWVGRSACILKGAEVPDNCIVGAHALVTRRYDKPGCAIAGNPAAVVREGVTWDRRML